MCLLTLIPGCPHPAPISSWTRVTEPWLSRHLEPDPSLLLGCLVGLLATSLASTNEWDPTWSGHWNCLQALPDVLRAKEAQVANSWALGKQHRPPLCSGSHSSSGSRCVCNSRPDRDPLLLSRGEWSRSAVATGKHERFHNKREVLVSESPTTHCQ